MSCLEGWQVIAEAKRIFGFDGWQRQTITVRCVAQAERLIGRDQKPDWGVTYTARVRVTVTAGRRRGKPRSPPGLRITWSGRCPCAPLQRKAPMPLRACGATLELASRREPAPLRGERRWMVCAGSRRRSFP